MQMPHVGSKGLHGGTAAVKPFVVGLALTCLVGGCSSGTPQIASTATPGTPTSSPAEVPAASPTAESQRVVYLGEWFTTGGGMKCRVDGITYGPGEKKQQESAQFTIVAWNKSREASGDCATFRSFNAEGEWACDAYVYVDRGLRDSYPDTSKCQVPKGTRFEYSLFEDTIDGVLNDPDDPSSIKVMLTERKG